MVNLLFSCLHIPNKISLSPKGSMYSIFSNKQENWDAKSQGYLLSRTIGFGCEESLIVKKSQYQRVYNSRTLKVEESIHIKFNDCKFDKELSELNDSLAYLYLGDLKTPSKEHDLDNKPKTHSTFKDKVQVALLSEVEPKNVEEALLDDGWIEAMQEELDQF
ncbi:hypothetical protein CR513_39734, partial [Mucuna pruriens]